MSKQEGFEPKVEPGGQFRGTSLDSPGEQATDDVLLEKQSKNHWGDYGKHTCCDDGDVVDIYVIGKHGGDHGTRVGLFGLCNQQSKEEFPPG